MSGPMRGRISLRLRSMSRRGQALIVALILLVVSAVMVLGNVYFFQNTAKLQVTHSKIIQERYLAEAGLQIAMQKLNADKDFSEEIQNLTSGKRNPFDTAAASGTIQWGGGTITVVMEPYE